MLMRIHTIYADAHTIDDYTSFVIIPLQALQEQLEAADAALQDSQQLRMEYDRMCQQAYELSRKLSQAESARGELQRELADARCG
jgi:Skp family chaperone for outer membrane proteins